MSLGALALAVIVAVLVVGLVINGYYLMKEKNNPGNRDEGDNQK